MESKKPPSKPLSGHKSRPSSVSQSSKHKSTPSNHASIAKGSKSADGSTSRPCPEHSFLTDVADVRQMEQGLLQLLEDFHSGKLQAFAGQDSPFEKMDLVREQQEKLARLHFELDSIHEVQSPQTVESRTAANTKLEKLMENLQELCVSVQNLQKDYPGS